MSNNDINSTHTSHHQGKGEAAAGSESTATGFSASHDAAYSYDGFVPDLMKVCESLTQSSTPHHENTNKFHDEPERQEEHETVPYEFHQPSREGITNSNFDLDHHAVSFHQDYNHHQQHPQSLNRTEELPSSVSTNNPGTALALNRKRVRVDAEHQQLQPKIAAWSENVHREFVGAIFDIGMKNSSPSTILDQMVRCSEEITSERIKSHLQKYRLNKDKSKKEYMHSYDAALAKFKACGVPPDAPRNLTAGAVAAYLTYASTGMTVGGISSQISHRVNNEHNPSPKNDINLVDRTSSTAICRTSLVLPTLTEEERRSPLGSALGYVIGLLFALRQQLIQQRRITNDSGLAQRQKHSEILLNRQQHDREDQRVPTASVGGEKTYYSYGDNLDNVDASILENSHTAAAMAGYNISNKNQQIQHQHQRSLSSTNNPSLEESQKMKLEMREQIAVQNKMRALKRKEIEKYQPVDEEGDDQDTAVAMPTHVPSSLLAAIEPYPFPLRTTVETEGVATHTGITPQRPRAQSESLPISYEDFWGVDMVDEQLFEFLMSAGDN